MALYVDAWMREQLAYDEESGSAFEVTEDWDEYLDGVATLKSLSERNAKLAAWRNSDSKDRGPKPARSSLADEDEMARLLDMTAMLNPGMRVGS